MKRFISLAVCVVFVMGFAGIAAAAKDTTGPTVGRDYSGYHFTQDGAKNALTSSNTSGVRFKASAFTDTFCIYGRGVIDGCGTEGRFDNGTTVVPQGLNHNQGCPPTEHPDCWFGVDLTDAATLWQLAEDGNPVVWGFPPYDPGDQDVIDCIATLGLTGGAANQVAWAGQSKFQQPGWTASPGYGNNWNALLQWARPAGTTGGQTVGLDFYFHHDSEPAYDFFNVEYDSFNTVVNVYTVDGSNAPFASPGLRYGVDVTPSHPIIYTGGDYAGPLNNEVIIRMTATSDGAWSDEDGLWPTECGLAMVDDITVNWAGGTAFEDFEAGFNPSSWFPLKAPFAGDFSEIHPRLTDIDPCREDETPVVAFIDFGQCPVNGFNNCGNIPCADTGGSQSITWSYGIPGGWVNDYNGGLAPGLVDLTNEVWSRPIDWDVPGPADDNCEVAGSFLRFTVWRHLPLLNGQFYVWHVRALYDASEDPDPPGTTYLWSPFDDRNFVYYSNGGNWLNVQQAVTDLVNIGGNLPQQVQIALGVTDLASLFAFPGTDATPSPAFDNVAYCKYSLQGPVFATRNIDRFMEAFPQSGNFDFSTQLLRDNSDCAIDMRDVSSGALNIAGDSMIVDIVSAIPGAVLTRVELKWVLDKNPLFEDAIRANLLATTTSTSVGTSVPHGWDQHFGGAVGDTSKVAGSGAIIQDRFFFRLPDVDFAYPGDVIRYYIEGEDDGFCGVPPDPRITTLPAGPGGGAPPPGFATGKENGQLYAPNHTLNMLPSVIDDGQGGQTQPWVLVWNDFGFRGGINDYYQAFEQNGWRRGLEWDMYTTWGPTSSVSNGLGSTGNHGATPDQLSGYEAILYFVGDLGTTTMSDGSDSGNNDKGDDLGTMQGWWDQAGEGPPAVNRFVAHFGDDLLDALLTDSPGPGGTYVATAIGAALVAGDVKPFIGGQSSPVVIPNPLPDPGDPCFLESYVAFGGCLGPNDFDNIAAVPPAMRGHAFTIGGAPVAGPGQDASVLWVQDNPPAPAVPDYDQRSITFPYGFVYVWNESGSLRGHPLPGGGPDSQRGRLLKEILECYFGGDLSNTGPGPVATDGPGRNPNIVNPRNIPNPFNPSTTIKFAVGVKQDVSVKMYNIRGELVVTLHEGPMEAGPREVVWQGTDSRGVPVSSGVYIARIQGKYNTQQIKTMLVK